MIAQTGLVNWLLSHWRRRLRPDYAKLAEAREMVSVAPDILDGTPVIRGTRIPVYDVAASVAAGLPRERIRAAYGINDRIIELAAVYAEATPPHARPRRFATLSPTANIVSESRVVRRRHR